jgi:hypothetical protein
MRRCIAVGRGRPADAHDRGSIASVFPAMRRFGVIACFSDKIQSFAERAA